MKNLVSLLQADKITTVKVKFPTTDKLYTYKTQLKCEPGNFAIVKIYGTDTYKVVQIIEVDSHFDITKTEKYDLQWLVQLVDPTTFDKLVTTDEVMRHTIKKIEVAEKTKELLKQISEEFSPESKAILDKVSKDFDDIINQENQIKLTDKQNTSV